MRPAALACSSLILGAATMSACSPCDLDPTSPQCLSSLGPPDQFAGLQIKPDTVYLFGPNETAAASLELEPGDSSYAVRLSNVPANLSASFSPASVAKGKPSTLRVSPVAWSVRNDVITVEAYNRYRVLTDTVHVVQGVPFTLSVGAPTVSAGTRTYTDVTIHRAANFQGEVELTLTAPQGIASSMLAGSTTRDTRSSAVLDADVSVAPGTYNVVVRGSFQSYTHSVVMPVKVVASATAYRLSLNPTILTIARGGRGSTDLGIERLVPHVTSIQLIEQNPHAGVHLSFATLTPDVGVSNVPIAVSVDPSTAAGTYSITIFGQWQNAFRSADLEVRVVDPDYTLSVSPARLTIIRGNSGTATVNINRVAGSEFVSLTPQNVPNGFSVSLPVQPVVSSSVPVPIAVNASVTPGTYTFQIVGNASGVRRTVDIVVDVIDPPLRLALNPSALTLITGGAPESIALSVQLRNLPTTATVRFTNLPPGVSATLEPNPLTGYNGVHYFTLQAASGASVGGPIPVTIEVTAGGVTQTITLSLTVLPPDFAIVLQSAPVTITQGAAPITTSITIVRNSAFAGVAINLSAAGLAPPSGLLSISPNQTTGAGASLTISVTPPPVGRTGQYIITVSGTANGITRSATLTLNVVAPSP
jgi:uncharacterized membrane protein